MQMTWCFEYPASLEYHLEATSQKYACIVLIEIKSDGAPFCLPSNVNGKKTIWKIRLLETFL
jgi:hypothetical protein